MNQEIFKEFIGQYSLNKTLRFELRPQGRTQEYIEARGMIGEDEVRAEDYKIVKKAIDEYHKQFMERSLKELQFDDLEGYCSLLSKTDRTEKEDRELEKREDKLRKQVVDCFKSDEKFKLLFNSMLITDELPVFVSDDKTKNALKNFEKFTTYFQGFFDNRKNMYSAEAKSTSVAYRIVNQNLPRFLDNQRVFSTFLMKELSDDLNEIENQLSHVLGGKSLKEFFELDYYSHTVTNKDIALYNGIIGGPDLNIGKKVKGINEYVIEHNQKVKKGVAVQKIPKLKPLYKQILADKESLSFSLEPFLDDEQLLESVRKLSTTLAENALNRYAASSLPALLEKIGEYNLNGIYIKNGLAITDLSNRAYGDWSVIKTCLEKEYDALNMKKNKNEKYYENRDKELKRQGSYSLAKLNQVVTEYSDKDAHLEQCYSIPYKKDGITLWDAFESALQISRILLNTDYTGKQELSGDKKSVGVIKELLDSIKDIENFIKPLLGTGNERDKDDNFYGELDVLYSQLTQITPLYNKVRNYVTKKPYSVEKIKLNFQNPVFLDGWAKGNELEKSGLLFKKGNKYYLGIIPKGEKNHFREYEDPQNEDDVLEKIDYMQVGDASKSVQNLMVIDGKTVKMNGRKESEGEHIGENLRLEEAKNKNLPNNINNIRKKKSYSIQSSVFNSQDLIDYINYYKARVIDYYSNYDFVFKESEQYNSFEEFTADIKQQAYKLKFRKVSQNYIDQLVNDGKLYLFQIYNKDFSEFSKGRPNLHTIYWKMLFDERNLENVVYKLNGEAEVFYRKASIKKENRIIHPKGKPIANKNLRAVEKGDTSTFQYDLIKDKRYTVDKYQFHVPITLNFCAEGKSNLNPMVYEAIRNNKDVNVIGIDRGERNLLYLCVVSPEGKILHQQSLNIIENDKGYDQDYHALLDDKEKKMDQARKDWMTIDSIKELKEGYLSQAIHVITDLMLKYNAVVVLEDLNSGFINGRKKVGKQVYQKFEKMLIDKLNYLVDKKIDVEEYGGALKAYQLTNKFESFAKLKSQSGFLFYVQAWNTSKIDPTTGFVNLLSTKYTNMNEAKEFLKKFDSIRFNKEKDYFEFALDYTKFTNRATGIQTKWVLCSQGTRIVTFRNPDKNNQWDAKEVELTEQLKQNFNQYGVEFSEENMIEEIYKVEQPLFFQNLMKNIGLMVQLRNSKPNTDIDYMLSPIKNSKGVFFDTRTYKKEDEDSNAIPMDADANGAYNIARKGLMLIERIRKGNEKIKLAISNQEWLEYAQKPPLL